MDAAERPPLQLTPVCPVLKAQRRLGDRQTEMQYEELRIDREVAQRTRVPSRLTDPESDPRMTPAHCPPHATHPQQSRNM